MTIPLLIVLGLALQSPRLAETFNSVQMMRSPQMSVVLPPVIWATNSFEWVGNVQADGYRLYQYFGSVTNIYHTTSTTIRIVYQWPDNVERWFYVVTATNEWGESPPSNRIHNPPYPPDRMTITSKSGSPVPLESSINLKQWSPAGMTPQTIVFTGSRRYYRGQGIVETDYNPLNQ